MQVTNALCGCATIIPQSERTDVAPSHLVSNGANLRKQQDQTVVRSFCLASTNVLHEARIPGSEAFARFVVRPRRLFGIAEKCHFDIQVVFLGTLSK